MNDELDLILSNATALDDDGWALIAPFGEHPKSRVANVNGRPTEQRFIQVLDNESADALLSKENSLFGKLKRAVVGIPVYGGHPDLRDHSPETLGNAGRKNQIGVVDKVRKGNLGIEAHFVLSPEGATAVANGSKFPSALWMVQPCGERDGAIVARPFKLISVGLTAHPNISGVDSLANARGAEIETEPETQMNKLVAAWLLAQGVTLANEATDQQVLEALQRHVTAKSGEVTVLGNEKSTLAGKITTLENEVTTLKGEKTSQATRITALENEVKPLKKTRAELTVDLAIANGRLKVAERAGKITALENSTEFEKDAKALLEGAKVVKLVTDARAGKVLANGMSDSNVRQTYCDAVKKHMEDTGETDAIKAHKAVMAAHPTLADSLRNPSGEPKAA